MPSLPHLGFWASLKSRCPRNSVFPVLTAVILQPAFLKYSQHCTKWVHFGWQIWISMKEQERKHSTELLNQRRGCRGRELRPAPAPLPHHWEVAHLPAAKQKILHSDLAHPPPTGGEAKIIRSPAQMCEVICFCQQLQDVGPRLYHKIYNKTWGGFLFFFFYCF